MTSTDLIRRSASDAAREKPGMTSLTPQAQLRLIMKRRRLTRQQVADLMGVSLHTVHSWTRPPSNKSARKVSAGTVELLAEKAGVRLPR